MQIYSDINKWQSQRISNLQTTSAQIFCPETRPAVPFLWQSGHVSVRPSHQLLRALSTCTDVHKSGRASTTEPPPPRCHSLTHVCQSATRLSHGFIFALPVFTHGDASDMEPSAVSSPVVTRGCVKFHYKQHALQRQIYETHLF